MEKRKSGEDIESTPEAEKKQKLEADEALTVTEAEPSSTEITNGDGDGVGGGNTLEAASESTTAAPSSPEANPDLLAPSLMSPDPSKLPLPSKQDGKGGFRWGDDLESPEPTTAKTSSTSKEEEEDNTTAANEEGSASVPPAAGADNAPVIGPQVGALAPGAEGTAVDPNGSANSAANDDSFNEHTCFPAEVSTLGSLLGRGGTRVKAIRQLSGARVSVEKKDVEPHRTSRVVTVSGRADQRSLAVFLSHLALGNGQLPAGYCHSNGEPVDLGQAAQTWATLEALALAFESTAAAATPVHPYYQAHTPAGAAAFGLPNPSTASAWGAERYMAVAAAAAAGAGALGGYGAALGGYSASAAAVYGLPMPAAGAAGVGQPLTYGPAGGKYKVSLCRNFSSTGSCRYGDRCDFAHGEAEMQAARAGQLPQQLASRGAGGAAGGMLMMGASGAAGAYGYAPARPAAGEQTMVIEVAMAQLGALFGKGGTKIAEIRAASLAKIQVEGRDIEPERQMRRVTLIGTPQSIQWAHYLIGQALEASGIQLPPQAAAAYAGQQAQPQFYGQVQATAAPQTAEEQYAQFMASAMSGQGGQQQQQPALAYDAYGQLTQR